MTSSPDIFIINSSVLFCHWTDRRKQIPGPFSFPGVFAERNFRRMIFEKDRYTNRAEGG